MVLTTTEQNRTSAQPPSFAEARTKRQKARASGPDPDYWYPVELDDAVKPGKVVEVVFWNQSIALFRGRDGALRALENRCAHRQLKLSLGNVEDCRLVCAYHGWQYDATGTVVDFSHDLFDKPTPHFRIRTYPVQVRYGIIWIFPGDERLAGKQTLPDIPEVEGKNRWAIALTDYTWEAHYSMIVENVSDFTHAYLHRKYQPFAAGKLTQCKLEGDRVSVSYETPMATDAFWGKMLDRQRFNTNHIYICYDYPYQWSNTGNLIRHYNFFLPVNERKTRLFFLLYFNSFRIPFTSIPIPRWLMETVLWFGKRFYIRPLVNQDGWAAAQEQVAYDEHFDAPPLELNPSVPLFQEVMIHKWEACLSRQHDPAVAKSSA